MRKLLCLLCLLALLALLCTSALAEGSLTIAGEDVSSYAIVIARDASFVQNRQAQDLAAALAHYYGVTLPLLTDDAPAAEREILVGPTNRYPQDGLDAAFSLLTLDGSRLVLTGGTDAALKNTVAYFISLCGGDAALQVDETFAMQGALFSPLLRIRESGDPCITWDGETGYYYALYSANGNDRVTIYRSRTLAGLGTAEGKDVYVAGDACWEEKEVMSRLFAPELHKIDGKWYIYASGARVSQTQHGKEKASPSIRLFCLEALTDDPYGEYAFKGFLDEELWAIDASTCIIDGQQYALCAGIVPGRGNVLTIARMENPWTIEPDTISRIAYATLPFETLDGLVNEGPWYFEGPTGRRFILYAANNVTSPYYCLNLLELVGDDPLAQSSWHKRETTAFATYGTTYCPGHGSVFMSPDGSEYWLAYHVKMNRSGGGHRCLQVQRLTFDENGYPNLDVPIQQTELLTAPSGE